MLIPLVVSVLSLPLPLPPPPPASGLASPRYATRQAAGDRLALAVLSARLRGDWPPDRRVTDGLIAAHESGDLEARVRAHELLRLAHAIRPRCLRCLGWAAGASCADCAARDGLPAVGGRGVLACEDCRRPTGGGTAVEMACDHCSGTGRCDACPDPTGLPAVAGRGPIDCRECGGTGRRAGRGARR